MTVESVLITVAVGAAAGWLATLIVPRWGYSLVFNIIIGVLGGVVGGWLLPKVGLHFGSGIGGALLTGTAGALVILGTGALLQKAGIISRRRMR